MHSGCCRETSPIVSTLLMHCLLIHHRCSITPLNTCRYQWQVGTSPCHLLFACVKPISIVTEPTPTELVPVIVITEPTPIELVPVIVVTEPTPIELVPVIAVCTLLRR